MPVTQPGIERRKTITGIEWQFCPKTTLHVTVLGEAPFWFIYT